MRLVPFAIALVVAVAAGVFTLSGEPDHERCVPVRGAIKIQPIMIAAAVPSYAAFLPDVPAAPKVPAMTDVNVAASLDHPKGFGSVPAYQLAQTPAKTASHPQLMESRGHLPPQGDILEISRSA